MNQTLVQKVKRTIIILLHYSMRQRPLHTPPPPQPTPVATRDLE